MKQQYLSYLIEIARSLADPELVEELDEDAQVDSLTLTEIVNRLELPIFENGQDNLLLQLADLPLPIYITTSYHHIIE